MLKRVYILLVTLLLISNVSVNADNNKPSVIIVSGQIINQKYGNAITHHKVYITAPDIKSGGNNYYNEVITDEEGFYFDTIRTTLSKGHLEIYTLDNDQNKVDSTVYFRFFRNTQMELLVNLMIEMPFHTNMLKARFKYVQKQGGSKYYYHFIDLTGGQNITSRKWSFGDGIVSYETNPDHTYLSPGIYRVKLTVEASFNGNLSTNSFSMMILIPDKTYYHIGGQVFANLFPIDFGKAFLYYKDSADFFIPVDTVTFDTLGYYIFYNLPQGEYIIKAQPCQQSEYYGQMCPTYFGSSLKWQDAEVCEITATGWDYDINLLSGENAFSGEGIIKGNVYIVDNGLKRFGLNSSENITVYLLDTNENGVTYIYTDEDGAFNFDRLSLGTYKLYPEVTGVNTSGLPVELNNEVPEVDSVIIELSLTGVDFIISKSKANSTLLSNIYPNPVLNGNTIFVNIKLNTSQNVICTISDFLGNQLYQKQLFLYEGANKNFLPVGNIPNGVYLITVTDNAGNTGIQKLVVNR